MRRQPAPRRDQSAARARLQGPRRRSRSSTRCRKIADYLDDASQRALRRGTAPRSTPAACRTKSIRAWSAASTTTRAPPSSSPHGGLGAQNALLGGGRYDGLSEMLGGPKAPGIGFAIGARPADPHARRPRRRERCRQHWRTPSSRLSAMALNAPRSPSARESAAARACAIELGDGSFRLKKSFEIGDKLARNIVILGEDEHASGILTVKNFATGEQTKIPRDRGRVRARDPLRKPRLCSTFSAHANAPTPAASCAPPTPARPSSSWAGSIGAAITAT